jgi:putative cell wall-binding protein
MLYGTRASRTTWDYGAGGTTVSAKVPLSQSYRLQISSPCVGVLRTLSGSASSTKPIGATWDGKDSRGRMVPPGSYTATLTSGTSSSQAYPQQISLTVRTTSGAPPSYCPPRLGGKSRYDVAVAASKSASSSAKTIVIASGLDTTMGDALVAGPLARSKGGVLLLTQPGGLPSSVSAEIKRRQATTAYVVGGPASVSSNVESQLRNLGVTTVVRFGGQDRYEVATNVAKAISSTAPDAVVVSGSDAAFADGLMLSGPAGRLKRPILLVKKDSIPQATAGALSALRVHRTIVGGGPGSVSDPVLKKLPSAKRLGGANRYEVSVNAANWARSVMDVSDVLISSGRQEALADTLSGGQLGRVTLYVHEGGVPSQVAGWLDRSPDLKRVTVMGGPASVPDIVAGRAQQAVIS